MLRTVSGHEQQKHNNQQISCVQVPGQQIAQEGSCAGFPGLFNKLAGRLGSRALPPGLLAGLRPLGRRRRTASVLCLGWRRLGNGNILLPLSPLLILLLRGPLLDGASAKGSIGLGDVAIIHGITCLMGVGSHRIPEQKRQFLPAWQPAWLSPAWKPAHC